MSVARGAAARRCGLRRSSASGWKSLSTDAAQTRPVGVARGVPLLDTVHGDRAMPVRDPGGRAGRRRLRAVDAFRGSVLALMLLTPPVGDSFPLLRHAAWDGLTISDLLFPAFLFTSGVSLAFLLKPPVTPDVRRRLVRRVVALIVLGVLYNTYGTSGADLSQVRLTGVLQLIGLTGAATAAAVGLTRRNDGQDRRGAVLALIVLVLVAYGAGLEVLPRCGPEPCSPYHPLDLAVFGEPHVYQAGDAGYDPEGLAVVLAASALPLVGYLFGHSLNQRAVTSGLLVRFTGIGLALIAAGALIDLLQPINKRLHTPAFTLVSSGVAALGLAFALAALDREPQERPRFAAVSTAAAVPFTVLGRNALVVYLAERLLLQSARHTQVGETTLEAWLLDEVIPFTGGEAQLAYGALLLVTVLVITTAMWRVRWHVTL